MTEAATPDSQPGSIPQPEHPGEASLLPPDDRLVLRATKGDRRAFEAIYKRYHRDLYRFCLAMVGNPQDAQDALQNTMVKVLRALPGEKRQIQLKPWLYRIARNEAVETMRRRHDSAEIEPDQTASTAEVAETVETRERLRRLIADLEELPERQRAALVMRELAGLGFAQIGAAFETSAAVARQTVYEARLSLRQMEEGREMGCDRVMQELSDADGRVTRRREVRAHLRGCASCRAFRDSMAARRGEFAAIAPLPLAVSAVNAARHPQRQRERRRPSRECGRRGQPRRNDRRGRRQGDRHVGDPQGHRDGCRGGGGRGHGGRPRRPDRRPPPGRRRQVQPGPLLRWLDHGGRAGAGGIERRRRGGRRAGWNGRWRGEAGRLAAGGVRHRGEAGQLRIGGGGQRGAAGRLVHPRAFHGPQRLPRQAARARAAGHFQP